MPEASAGAAFGQGDASIQHMGSIWGPRSHRRRSHGTEARTRLIFTLEMLHRKLTAMGPQYVPPGLGDAAEVLSDLWAGERGWETDALIRGFGASKGSSTIVQMPQERGDDGKR